MPKGTESFGYDLYESRQYLAYLRGAARAAKKKGLRGGIRWALLALIGLATGVVAIGVEASMELLMEIRDECNNLAVEHAESIPGGVWLQYLAFVGFRLAMAAVAGYLVCFVEVLAAGSGIPEIKCYLNGVCLTNVVGVKTLIAKAVGIIFSVGAGLPVGKEGPMIHSGAIIGALATKANIARTVRPFRLESEMRDLIAAGASSGVAAAFGAPMGSVLFAIEEGTSHMNPSIMTRLFVACCTAAGVSRAFSGAYMAKMPIGRLGSSVPVSFGKFKGVDYDLLELPLFLVLAVIGGFSGSIFCAFNKKLSEWRKKHISPTGWSRFAEVLVIDVFVVSILFWIPIAATGGIPRRLSGDDGLTVTLQLYWKSGTQAMKSLFHDKVEFHPGFLLLFTILNFQLSCLTYGLGVPSGLFVPSLLTGAAYGRFMGEAIHIWFGDIDTPKRPWADVGVYSLIGAVANLSGAARITISLAMILMEATGDACFSLPIFMTVMVAKWVADGLNWVSSRGIYDLHIVELKHIPFLERTPERHTIGLAVREVMSKTIVSFRTVETVGKILDTLEDCDHNGFPVVHAGSKRLAGMLTRSMLMSVLERGRVKGLFQARAEFREIQPFPYEEMLDTVEKQLTLEELIDDLNGDCRPLLLDLRPYINRNGYSMPTCASVASTFMLFRQLGLRHLPIVDSRGKVCGMITRKDLIFAEEADLAEGAPVIEDNDSLDSRDDTDQREMVIRVNRADGGESTESD